MTRLLWLQSDGNFEPPQDPENKLFLAGVDEQGTKGYILTSLENLTNKHVADQASLMFECSRFLVLESPTKDQAFEFLYTNYPLPTPKKYPLKNLTLIRWDCFSSMLPADFFQNYVKSQGGTLVVWDIIAPADAILILVYSEKTLELPEPNEELKYDIASSDTLQLFYSQYVEDADCTERTNI